MNKSWDVTLKVKVRVEGEEVGQLKAQELAAQAVGDLATQTQENMIPINIGAVQIWMTDVSVADSDPRESHAHDCPYRFKGECECHRSDPTVNPDTDDDYNEPVICLLCGKKSTLGEALNMFWEPYFWLDSHTQAGGLCCRDHYGLMVEETDESMKGYDGPMVLPENRAEVEALIKKFKGEE